MNSQDVELFNFFELFGDGTTDDDVGEDLLTADDQQLFAQFLDGVDSSGLGLQSSLMQMQAMMKEGPGDTSRQHHSNTSGGFGGGASQHGDSGLLPMSLLNHFPMPSFERLSQSLGQSNAMHSHDSITIPMHHIDSSNAGGESMPKRLKSLPEHYQFHPQQPYPISTPQQILMHQQNNIHNIHSLMQAMHQEEYMFKQEPQDDSISHHNPRKLQQQQNQYQHHAPDLLNLTTPPSPSFTQPPRNTAFLPESQSTQRYEHRQQQPPQQQHQQLPQNHHLIQQLDFDSNLSATASSSPQNQPLPIVPKKRGRKPKEISTSLEPVNSLLSAATSLLSNESPVTAHPAATTTTAKATSNKSAKLLLTASEKKANHIQAEQRRRMQIREALKELSSIVPGLRPPIEGEANSDGSSRVEILEGTRLYIEKLKAQNTILRNRAS